jgi:GNAT superfamily N-acetyltransferase
VARFDVRPLATERLADYLAFFEERAFTDNPRWASCYCYFPYHDPKSTDWPTRTAAQNRTAICECINGGRAQGHLAYEGDQVVGWCNAGPWSLYPTLSGSDSEPKADTGCIFCFVVAPTHRRQGIARALLDAACDALKSQQLRWVRAAPSRKAEGTAQNYHGPLEMYLAAGFSILNEEPDGRVHVCKALS